MTRRRVPIRMIVPLMVLFAWLRLIGGPLAFSFLGQWHPSSNAGSQSSPTASRERGSISAFAIAVYKLPYLRSTQFSQTVQSINLPAFAVDLLIDRFSSGWPNQSTPWELDFEEWRAIIYPIYCLPFWWFAGLGTESLLGRCSLRWPTLLLGSLLCGFLLFIAMGLTFGVPAEDHKGMGWVFYGFALWIALFATFPAVWVGQWMDGRRHRLAALSE